MNKLTTMSMVAAGIAAGVLLIFVSIDVAAEGAITRKLFPVTEDTDSDNDE